MQAIHSKILNLFTRAIFLTLFFTAFLVVSGGSIADEFDDFDDDVTVIYLKKIRDAEGNYLADITKAAAKALSKSGEFSVKRYKSKSYKSGPIITVSSPSFAFTPHKDGMSTKELATTSLALVSELGGIFGLGKQAEKAREANDKINDPNSVLAGMSDDDALLVTMNIRVLIEDDSGVEVSRVSNSETVFENKSGFKAKEQDLMRNEILSAVKKAMGEYIEDTM